MENKELYHHGILGMKWGVRRYQNKDGTLTLAGKRRRAAESDDDSSQTKKTENATRPKTLSEMSDAEIRERINRIQLERQYRELTTPKGQSRVDKGKAFASRVLEKSGENLMTQVVNHYGAKALNKLIGETTSVKDSDTGEITEVIKEVIFANNQKKK